MGGCSALNCTNHSRNKIRMVRFPKDPKRRKKWAINCRRDDWEPGKQAQLCIEHFEDLDFEIRKDGSRQLKKTAVPTIFDIPSPPKKRARRQVEGTTLSNNTIITTTPKKLSASQKDSTVLSKTAVKQPSEQLYEVEFVNGLKKRIATLESEVTTLKNELAERDKSLSFLSEEQMEMAKKAKKSIANWSDDAIRDALKLRFVLGKHGYKYLHKTGYPTPSNSTLNRRLHSIRNAYVVPTENSQVQNAKPDDNTSDKDEASSSVNGEEVDVMSNADGSTYKLTNI